MKEKRDKDFENVATLLYFYFMSGTQESFNRYRAEFDKSALVPLRNADPEMVAQFSKLREETLDTNFPTLVYHYWSIQWRTQSLDYKQNVAIIKKCLKAFYR